MNILNKILCLYFISFLNMQAHTLVEVQKINPHIRLEIMYASNQNFTGKRIYTSAKCFLIKEVAQALDAVQKELEKDNLGLLIWDGYRPHSAQWKLWHIVSDPRYVADPKKGSRHNRGCAVDLTLVKLSDGKKIAMPTGFDDFTKKAHIDYMDLSDEVIKNRNLLETVMKKHGFYPMSTEWWHFDYKEWEKYPILDIPFSELS